YFYDANQGIDAIYLNGLPSQVVAYNFPLHQWSIFHETAAYGQDSWTIARRITVNAGLRFQHFRTFNPPQSSPAPYFPTLFPVRSFPQSQDLANWNTFRPRLGVAIDLTGKGSSVLRASFDEFDVIEGTELAEALNPNGFSSQTFPWTDTNGDGIPQLSEWLPSKPQVSSGGAFTHVDPNLKRPYSREINIGYEQQLFHDVRVGVNYYHRSTKNLFASRNLLNLPSDYTPVTADPATGAPILNPLTNQPMTLYNLNPAKVGLANFVITNIPDLNNNAYNAVEFTGQKRMSKNWQLLAGFTIQRKKGTYRQGTGEDFNNPNNLIFAQNNILDYDATYVFKVDSTYVLPMNINVGANFQHYTGYPIDAQVLNPPQAVFDVGLNQGPITVSIANRGSIRLPDVNLFNLRFSRPTRLSDRVNLEPMVDLFNITNSQTVTQEISTFGPTWLQPADLNGNPGILNPFIARFGLRLTF
ncbi:MAG TPA: TonB-dependent receptor, partial [Terriglobales bacterium]|nr:TonB-dependent receptor [Terriglobales bacterium]